MCGNIRRKGAFIENSKNFKDHPATLVTTTSAEIPTTTMIDSLDDDDILKDTEGIFFFYFLHQNRGRKYIKEQFSGEVIKKIKEERRRGNI